MCTTLCIIFFTKIALFRRPAGYVIGIRKVRPRKTGISNPLSTRIFGAHLPFSINRINLHIMSAQHCALYSSPKSPYSAVLPDMLSGIRKVRPRKTGISNPLSTNRLGHFLTADCKSAETPSGAEEPYPTGRIKKRGTGGLIPHMFWHCHKYFLDK